MGGVIAGCSAPGAGVGLGRHFHRDQKHWALPLNTFLITSLGAHDYAENLLTQKCMNRNGYRWPVPPFDTHVAPSATVNQSHRRLFNVAIAEKYGYHLAPSNQPNAAKYAKLNSEHLGRREETTLDRCISTVRKRRLPEPALRPIEGLRAQAYDQAESSDKVKAAGRKWHRCMLPAGVSDLPKSPTDMPSPSITSRFLKPGPNVTGTERRIAVKDAHCRKSSGWSSILYNTEVNNELKLISEHESELKRILAQNKKVAKGVKHVLTEYGH